MAGETRQDWIRRELGGRIDALEVALNSFTIDDTQSVESFRRVLRGLEAAARSAGLDDLANGTARVQAAEGPELENRAIGLIQLLRDEVRRAQPQRAKVMVVGSDKPLLPDLVSRLKTIGREAVVVGSAREAEITLHQHDIAFLLVDYVLPDRAIGEFVSTLRSRPLSAGLPCIVVSSKIARTEAAGLAEMLPDLDGFFGKPVNPDDIIAEVDKRLKASQVDLKAANRDPVTGLLNRAAFGDFFERISAEYRKQREPVAIAVMKIDRFNEINEQFGSETGDNVLRHFSGVLSRHFRATDIVSRFGGCEFMALFPGEDSHGASRALERIRQALVRHPFEFPGGRREPLRLYAGVSVMEDEANLGSVVDRTDLKMHQSGSDTNSGAQNAAPKRKERIVLISGSDTTSRVLESMLLRESFDFQRHASLDGTAAQALGTARSHIVIVDDPGNDPNFLDVLRRLREISRLNRTPILLLTTSEAQAARGHELGATDACLKPLDLAAFMKSVRRLLTRGLGDERGEGPESLLVIGNEIHTLLMVGTALQKQTGFLIRLARGGHDGAVHLGKHRPTVCLIDLKPRTEEWNRVIEALHVVRPAPAIVVAAENADVPYLRSLRAPHIGGILAKPLQPLNIARQVQDLLTILPAGAAGRAETAAVLKEEIDRVMRVTPAGAGR